MAGCRLKLIFVTDFFLFYALCFGIVLKRKAGQINYECARGKILVCNVETEK